MESDISSFIKNSELNKNLATLAIKAKLKAEQDKIMKLQMHDLSYFVVKSFFGDDRLSTSIYYVRIKKDKGTDYALSWKSKGVIYF